jgi:hypothetical protein
MELSTRALMAIRMESKRDGWVRLGLTGKYVGVNSGKARAVARVAKRMPSCW